MSETKKKKVSSAKIVVNGKKNKPYFSIEYYDIEEQEWYSGYGSYYLDLVFDWLNECFEIIESEETDEIR